MATSHYLLVLMMGQLGPMFSEGIKLTATESSQTIETNGYSWGSYYAGNTFQTWTIETEDDSALVEINIDMDIQYCWDCYCDYIQIFDGLNSAATRLGTFCGTSSGNVMKSSGHEMYLVFRSDSYEEKRGFKLTYQQIEKEETDAWMIVGIVLAVVIVLSSIGVGICIYHVKKTKNQVSPIQIQPQPRVQPTPAHDFALPQHQGIPCHYLPAIEMQEMNRGNVPGVILGLGPTHPYQTK